ncbi:hypothetical protein METBISCDRAFT_24739 [Metschnikowia bicuspidata]|uniref:Zinc finger C3HC4 RING-type domain-containing protein n=1 Tax=Metschnikowia bicuspidata TaxID=27322 RepID=A0A4P9Z842_9ASCO|nr:hypothetical protein METBISCDRAFT_24739 [Metschnikowia bicuspidata]
MSRPEQSKTPVDVVSVSSDDEDAAGAGASGVRRQSAIEILSDVSDDDALSGNDLEIISVNAPAESLSNSGTEDDIGADPEVQIIGHNQILLPDLEALIRDALESTAASSDTRNTRSRAAASAASAEVVEIRLNRRRLAPLFAFFRRVRQRFDGYSGLEHSGLRQIISSMSGFSEYEQAVPVHVLEAIRRSEEREMDQKLQKENKINHKTLLDKKRVAEETTTGYTSIISADENYVCELCAVVLGEGIPEDFVPDPELDEHMDEHAVGARTMAPWFCIRQCFETDIELLKRVFVSKCGHVFCGRCIKNIGSRPPLSGRKTSEKISIINPRVAQPKKCPAKDCGVTFKGKNAVYRVVHMNDRGFFSAGFSHLSTRFAYA